MDQDQPGPSTHSVRAGPRRRSAAAVLLAGTFVLTALVAGATASPSSSAGAQTPAPTATSAVTTATTATTAAPTTAAAPSSTITAVGPPSREGAATSSETHQEGNVWIVVAATLALIAALVAIAVIGKRRDISSPASVPATPAGRRPAATPPSGTGTDEATPRPMPSGEAKAKPGGAADRSGARSTAANRRAPAKRKRRKR